MTNLVLYDVSVDDQIELREKVGENVRFETLPAETRAFGEPVTIAVIGLSTIAVTGLVAYLLKGRQSGAVKIAHMRIETPNGSIELNEIELNFENEEEASAQLVNALQGWMAYAIAPAN
ncbi:MAG: hypothetical protein JJU18_04880 [Oceanicaulis sp.]|nr:hypothetical protein [Oceanicaulis sp.]